MGLARGAGSYGARFMVDIDLQEPGHSFMNEWHLLKAGSPVRRAPTSLVSAMERAL
jgi:hypothetical protein